MVNKEWRTTSTLSLIHMHKVILLQSWITSTILIPPKELLPAIEVLFVFNIGTHGIQNRVGWNGIIGRCKTTSTSSLVLEYKVVSFWFWITSTILWYQWKYW